MKVLFLHGAVKNAGDFLIADRSQKLIEYCVPNCNIIPMWEGSSIKEISKNLYGIDGIVFGGGPFFTHHIHPRDIPLVENLADLSIPMLNIGGGWYGSNIKYSTVKNYYIDSSSLELLKKIEISSGSLSCRDWFTVNMLRNKGFAAEMHGCPAWFDTTFNGDLNFTDHKEIDKICVSDPANPCNYSSALKLLKRLRMTFHNAEIIFVFHRGTWLESDIIKSTEKKMLSDFFENYNVDCIDISGSSKGFSVYDSCNLHIGFRVHAHIYNLSHKKESILLEEDGRGAGVNQALGLANIHAYSEERQFKPDLIRKTENRIFPKGNSFIVDEVMMMLKRNENTGMIEYKQAFERMNFYFSKMCKHICKIKEW